MNFLHGKAQIPKGNVCFKLFCNHKHLMFFLYKLAIYHWKVIKETYTFVIESISIKIHIKTLQSHKIFDKFVRHGTWLFPRAT